MLETTKKLYDEMDEMMKLCMKQLDVSNIFLHMDTEEIELMQRCFKMYKSAKDLMIMQAEIIENQDKKLDMILSKLSKMETRSL